MQSADTDYKQKRESAHAGYKAIGSVQCPALEGNVVFAAEGFNHLIYKGRKERDQKQQVLRFSLISRARTLLALTTVVQEYEESSHYMRVNRNGSYIQKNVLVRFWGFVGIIDNLRIKVVVRQIGNGKKEFYSVIPGWILKKYKDTVVRYNSTESLEHEPTDSSLKNATSDVSE
jgi:ribosomal protein L21E